MIEGGRRARGTVREGNSAQPLVTVITVVRNGIPGIEETIRAVVEQTYQNLEYLIIDGASTDGTLDVLRRLDDVIDYWISEPDRGLYDAMNKGVALVADPQAYILFANSGDRLYSPDAVELMVRDGAGADFVYGKQLLTDGSASALLGQQVTIADLARQNISHAALLTRRSVFGVVGMFDLQYRIVADYDFFVRCMSLPVTSQFVDRVVAEVGMFGLSETNFMLLLHERLHVIRRNFRGSSRLTAVVRIYCVDIPRHFLRGQLRQRGLLGTWRAIKAMRFFS